MSHHQNLLRRKFLPVMLTGLLTMATASQAYAQWASGEIRRVDPDNLRLTIKHGEIKSLDMPPMTMVFHVKNRAVLGDFKAQDKIEFQATAEGTKYFVTEIRRAP